ncbi:MAG: metallophosphoesterase [Bacteriovoracaceae bacterium]|nr:metallophosphoesterase [Bacteriovoracaceae bacterium]
MKYLRNHFRKGKTIVVLSDLHLGAGQFRMDLRNPLEDFFFDRELIDLFHFFSSGIYKDRKVEIVFNGDYIDFLATPFVDYFEDEFWSETSAITKLNLVRDAHREVFIAMANFVKVKDKKIVYVVGNHDAEILLPGVRETFLSFFPENLREHVLVPEVDTYSPTPGVYLQHGHQYERAHNFDPKNAFTEDSLGKRYIIPTWGAYYCTHIINKFKTERSYINQIQPIKKYLIHGLLFDAFFTLRFMFSNTFFFVMVRLWYWYYHIKSFRLKEIINDTKEELMLFQNYETLTRKFFQKNPDTKILITGHTHHPQMRTFKDGTTYINTGTWTKIISLDFSFNFNGHYLTFAKIDTNADHYELQDFNRTVHVELLEWKGSSAEPYRSYLS